MELLSTQPVATSIALGAILLGLLVLAFALGSSRSRRNSAATTPTADPEQARLLADMRELADRLATELDTKSAKLESLLQDADRKARSLEQQRARQETAEQVHAAELKPLAREQPAGHTPRPTQSSRPEPMHAAIHSLSDQGLTPVQIAERTGVPTGQVELILALRRASTRVSV